MIRVLIADDHTLVRQALGQMLRTETDMMVVDEVENAEEAVQHCKSLEPDVVLMDIHMPHGSEGIDATRQIAEAVPNTRVIMLTMERQDEYLFEAIKAGAKGYLLKNADSDELLKAIRDVASGEATLNPQMARKVLDEFRRIGESESQDQQGEQLTEREKEILGLLSQGAPNHDIAQQLSISEKTVRNRLSVIYDKLHITNRTQAALLAMKRDFPIPKQKDS